MQQYTISKEELLNWCSIPYQELENNSDLKTKLVIEKDRGTMMRTIGNIMTEEVIEHNKAGIITKWVLPAGPCDEYDTFIERVNRERISLKNLWIFHMDEFLDWEGRPYPVGDTYESLKGTMLSCFYGRIDPELTVPEEQRIWPDIHNLDYPDEMCDKLGGIDTVYAGIGCKGLVAFNEVPRRYTEHISLEQYAKSKTRIVDINEDTVVALSERSFGGNYDRVPPRSITVGFHIILSAKRAIYMIATGNWKQTAVRVALFSEPTLEYPVTLLPKFIPDITLFCNVDTADHPMSHEIKGW
jgi:glucosamine-6-phosphate deaminase